VRAELLDSGGVRNRLHKCRNQTAPSDLHSLEARCGLVLELNSNPRAHIYTSYAEEKVIVTVKSSQELPTICVFSGNSRTWNWYALDCKDQVRWIFYNEDPMSFAERKIHRPKLSRIFGAFRCVRGSLRENAVAIAAHSQISTMWCAIALRLLRVPTPLLSFSFHFSELPTGIRRAILKWALVRVERFTVHSEPERARYSAHFGIPITRFDLIRWGVRASNVEFDTPSPVTGKYICALGKDGRDYATLLSALRQLPETRLVVVAQPYNLVGVDIPDNVEVFYDIPLDVATGILKGSQFMVLPLKNDDTSCGHITIVSAMFCRKAIVATRSSGIADYFPKDYDSPKVPACDVDGWVQALRGMIDNPDRIEKCASMGEKFAYSYCSHDEACKNTLAIFRKTGIPIAL
jgi:glycosyltransferase involved in cell wall biosynthesis